MRRLFVYVPPLGGPLASWTALRGRLVQEPECADDEFQHWPPRPRDHIGLLTRGRIDRHAAGLAARLAECDAAATARGRPYDEIVLLGSSIGALLVRWAWLDGMGAFTEGEPAPWAAKVRRIVLFGGLNRGLSTRLGPGRRTPRLVMMKVLISLLSPVRFAWQDALAGSAFVTNLRLTWMRYLGRHPDRSPQLVQLLPVAVLAEGLRGLRMRDIGDGGFGGFAELDGPPAIQWPYFPGGHGAPLSTSERRRDVVRYITTGTATEPDGLIDSPGGVLALVSRLSPVLIVAATALAATAIGWAVLAPGVATVAAAAVVAAVVMALAFA